MIAGLVGSREPNRPVRSCLARRRLPRSRAAVLALALTALAAVGAPAQSDTGAEDAPPASYTIVDSVRLPAESFVGDAVELRYTIRTNAELTSPAEPPQPSWGEITDVAVFGGDGEWDVRIVLVPYEPGTLTIPRLPLGSISLDGMSVLVASVLDEQSELRAIYGPQRLPGTQLAVVLVALAIVVPAAAALYLLGPGRAVARRLLERYRARIPYRSLMRTLDRLEANLQRDTARDFYTTLIHSIQDLMTSRLDFECRAATSTELVSYLPALAARCGLPARAAEPVRPVLEAADSAKFAHSQIRRRTRSTHLDTCREVFGELEAARRRLRARPRASHGKEAHARL